MSRAEIDDLLDDVPLGEEASKRFSQLSRGQQKRVSLLIATIHDPPAILLAVGQALVGLVKSADTVNAVGRLSYLPLFALGLFGYSELFGTTFETISQWSPGGAVATLLAGAMHPAAWSAETWWALLASALYSVAFTGIGVRWFRWSTH